jgi:hypothetical protein
MDARNRRLFGFATSIFVVDQLRMAQSCPALSSFLLPNKMHNSERRLAWEDTVELLYRVCNSAVLTDS